MLHGEAVQVPCTVQVLEGRRKVRPSQEPWPPKPWDPSTTDSSAARPPHPQRLLPQQCHLPPLPELLFHQSADTELLVHLLQQLGLWDRSGVTYDLRPFKITRKHAGLYKMGVQKRQALWASL